jgi:hypothetical protein
MKAELKSYDDEVFGIELTAESEGEDKALRRFWDGGVKINAITCRRNNESSLQLTFADLLDVEGKEAK